MHRRPDLHINAAAFRQALSEATGRQYRQQDLQRAMNNRGFNYKRLACNANERVYTGLRIT